MFIFGGGLYTLISHPLPSAYYNGKFYFLYPSISSQFISDTVVSMILYALGFIGLFIIYQSTKSAYKPRQAYMMLVIGVTFLLLAYIFLEGAISLKSSGG
jgi:membrane-bound ClpP family serine protease